MNNPNKIIISLLVANLAATIWFGNNSNDSQPSQKPYEKASNHQLPDLITMSVKSELLDTFMKNFNSKNYSGLYEMLGPIAKLQTTKEDMGKEFGKLTKYFDSVNSGAFRFAEFSTQKGSRVIYVLNYSLKFSGKSNAKGTAKLKITIAIDGNNYQVYGLNVDGNLE